LRRWPAAVQPLPALRSGPSRIDGVSRCIRIIKRAA
jgi:hypothetical protein